MLDFFNSFFEDSDEERSRSKELGLLRSASKLRAASKLSRKEDQIQIAVVGTAGAGKSTLCNLFANAAGHDEDNIFAEGKALDSCTRKIQRSAPLWSNGCNFVVVDTTAIDTSDGIAEAVEQANLVIIVLDDRKVDDDCSQKMKEEFAKISRGPAVKVVIRNIKTTKTKLASKTEQELAEGFFARRKGTFDWITGMGLDNHVDYCFMSASMEALQTFAAGIVDLAANSVSANADEAKTLVPEALALCNPHVLIADGVVNNTGTFFSYNPRVHALCVAGGTGAGAATGGVAGCATGAGVGGALTIIPSLFTFGVASIFGSAAGGFVGAVVGSTAGGTTGAVCGHFGYAKRRWLYNVGCRWWLAINKKQKEFRTRNSGQAVDEEKRKV